MKSSLRHIPNLITVLRFILLFPVLWYLLKESYQTAFYLFILAGLSDGVDGFLARRFNWQSKFGSIADPIVDKCLMLSLFYAMAWLGILPIWLVGVIFLRDIIILCGAFYDYIKAIRREFTSRFISKVNTCIQAIFITLMLFNLGFLMVPMWILDSIMLLLLITTLWSMLDYIWIWSRQKLSTNSNSEN